MYYIWFEYLHFYVLIVLNIFILNWNFYIFIFLTLLKIIKTFYVVTEQPLLPAHPRVIVLGLIPGPILHVSNHRISGKITALSSAAPARPLTHVIKL